MLSPMNPVFVSFSSVFIYCSFLKLFVLKDLDGKWGMRIESALSVRKVKVSFWGDLLFRVFAKKRPSLPLFLPPLRHEES